MTSLILTTDASAAGALAQAGLGDLVIAIERRLVWGPLPSEAQLEALFAPRAAQQPGLHRLDDTPRWRLDALGAADTGLIELSGKFDSVELWIGPEPNAQLILLWLLDHWRGHSSAPRLMMRQSSVAIGDVDANQRAKLNVSAVEVSYDHLDAAGLAWRAYRAPTPEAWFDLLNADLSLLPQLGACVLDLLEELPAPATGLGATEKRMLELIAPGDVQPFAVFPGHEKPNGRRVFKYWEVGALLDGLARCSVPAVSGLNAGPFSLEMHNDAARHERYKQSRLSLTELGKAALAGEEDLRRHNPIRRWWGGTEPTNDRLWRWDAETRSLVAP